VLGAARVALRRACLAGRFDRPDRGAMAPVKDAVDEPFGRFKSRSEPKLCLPKVEKSPANNFDIRSVRGKVGFWLRLAIGTGAIRCACPNRQSHNS
jgi:hypothetical protein